MTHRLSTRIAEKVAAFAGSMGFLYLNAVWFLIWIVMNVWLPFRFDPFPFQLLTLSVSLEAIFLSCFVLLAQNRQAQQDRQLAEQDAQTNQEAEKEIRAMMTHLHEQDAQIASLTAQLEAHQR